MVTKRTTDVPSSWRNISVKKQWYVPIANKIKGIRAQTVEYMDRQLASLVLLVMISNGPCVPRAHGDTLKCTIRYASWDDVRGSNRRHQCLYSLVGFEWSAILLWLLSLCSWPSVKGLGLFASNRLPHSNSHIPWGQLQSLFLFLVHMFVTTHHLAHQECKENEKGEILNGFHSHQSGLSCLHQGFC